MIIIEYSFLYLNIFEMSKSKLNRGRSIDLYSAKKKTKNERSIKWTDQHFRELYPKYKPTKNYNQERCLSINIIYKDLPLKAQIPIGTPYSDLPMLLHKAIYDYLVQQKDRNSLIKCALVIGFETGDLLIDYKISIGNGILNSKINFNCVEYVAQGRLNKYKIQKCLAIGGFSKVYLVRSLRDGQFYAMKVMMKQFISQNQKQSVIENQKIICQNLNHPFIVKLNHCFQTHHFVCFILDYCPGGQLFYYLKQVKRMPEEDARFYFIEILYGLMYLHQNKIIYRDLKPQNLLISHDGHIKIADFGLSKSNMGERQVTYSFCGSTEYMPPQMILRQGHSFNVDYYTLGALLYQLVTGLPPFYSHDQQEIKDSIVNEQLSFPNYVQLSNQIKNLLLSLLNKNPKHRIGSFSGVKQILFHPWVGKVNSQMVLSKKLTPPHLPSFDKFNFDENQLGQDEQQFTNKLKKQHLIPISKEKLIFKDFHFTNQCQLKPQLTNIFKKYSIKPAKTQKQSLTKAFSMQNLRKQSKSRLKRQSSTPYLTHQNEKAFHNTEKFQNNLKYSLTDNFSSKNKNMGYVNKKLKSKYQQAFTKKSQTFIKKQLKQNILDGSMKQKKKIKLSTNYKTIQNI